MKARLSGSEQKDRKRSFFKFPDGVRLLPPVGVKVLGFKYPGPVFHTLMSIINDGHYCHGAGGKPTGGSYETLTLKGYLMM